MLDLIIRGGQVVTSEGVAQMDLGVRGEQIAVVALPGTLEGEAADHGQFYSDDVPVGRRWPAVCRDSSGGTLECAFTAGGSLDGVQPASVNFFGMGV